MMKDWTSSAGSPTTRFYDRVAIDQGGRSVGVQSQAYRLRDGRLVDVWLYEIPGNANPDGVTMLPEDWIN